MTCYLVLIETPDQTVAAIAIGVLGGVGVVVLLVVVVVRNKRNRSSGMYKVRQYSVTH